MNDYFIFCNILITLISMASTFCCLYFLIYGFGFSPLQNVDRVLGMPEVIKKVTRFMLDAKGGKSICSPFTSQ